MRRTDFVLSLASLVCPLLLAQAPDPAAIVRWSIGSGPEQLEGPAPPEAAAIRAGATKSPARLKAAFGGTEVWVRSLAGGAFAVAAFNKGERAAQVDVVWKELGIGGQPKVRDALSGTDLGKIHGGFAVKLPGGGAALYRVIPGKKGK